MKKITHIILLLFIVSSCKNSISEADKKRVTELNEKAVEYRMNGDLENAKRNYSKAIEIDQSNTFIRYELIGVYVEQDSLDKAFELLEKIPAEQKETEYYYQVKGGLFEFNGQKEQAIENYKKALELTDKPKVKDEMGLSPLVNYAMLETLAGKKEQAVTGLSVKDFELLVSLGVFNSALMNDAVYKFKRYEDASLEYIGINRHEGEDVGLFDTVLSRQDYEESFVNED